MRAAHRGYRIQRHWRASSPKESGQIWLREETKQKQTFFVSRKTWEIQDKTRSRAERHKPERFAETRIWVSCFIVKDAMDQWDSPLLTWFSIRLSPTEKKKSLRISMSTSLGQKQQQQQQHIKRKQLFIIAPNGHYFNLRDSGCKCCHFPAICSNLHPACVLSLSPAVARAQLERLSCYIVFLRWPVWVDVVFISIDQ